MHAELGNLTHLHCAPAPATLLSDPSSAFPPTGMQPRQAGRGALSAAKDDAGTEDAPASLRPCSCVSSAAQCCPPSACDSPHCAALYRTVFLSAAQPLPEARGFVERRGFGEDGDGGTVKAGSRSRTSAAPAVADLSQDMDALLQALQSSQRPVDAAAKPSPQRRQETAEGNAGACDALLSAMSEQWKRWEEQAQAQGQPSGGVEGPVELRGAWPGLGTAGQAAESATEVDAGRERATPGVTETEMEEDERDDD